MQCLVTIIEGVRPTAAEIKEIEDCFQAELKPLQEELARVQARKDVYFELKDGIYEQIIEILPAEIQIQAKMEAIIKAYRDKYSPHVLF